MRCARRCRQGPVIVTRRGVRRHGDPSRRARRAHARRAARGGQAGQKAPAKKAAAKKTARGAEGRSGRTAGEEGGREEGAGEAGSRTASPLPTAAVTAEPAAPVEDVTSVADAPPPRSLQRSCRSTSSRSPHLSRSSQPVEADTAGVAEPVVAPIAEPAPVEPEVAEGRRGSCAASGSGRHRRPRCRIACDLERPPRPPAVARRSSRRAPEMRARRRRTARHGGAGAPAVADRSSDPAAPGPSAVARVAVRFRRLPVRRVPPVAARPAPAVLAERPAPRWLHPTSCRRSRWRRRGSSRRRSRWSRWSRCAPVARWSRRRRQSSERSAAPAAPNRSSASSSRPGRTAAAVHDLHVLGCTGSRPASSSSSVVCRRRSSLRS